MHAEGAIAAALRQQGGEQQSSLADVFDTVRQSEGTSTVRAQNLFASGTCLSSSHWCNGKSA